MPFQSISRALFYYPTKRVLLTCTCCIASTSCSFWLYKAANPAGGDAGAPSVRWLRSYLFIHLVRHINPMRRIYIYITCWCVYIFAYALTQFTHAADAKHICAAHMMSQKRVESTASGECERSAGCRARC